MKLKTIEERAVRNYVSPKESEVKGSKLTSFIVIVLAVALLLFTYVVLLSEIKRMNKDKITKQEMLNERNGRVEIKTVEVQKLMSENRIVEFAQDSLKFIRPDGNLETITISKEQINQIIKAVNEKYN